MSLTNRFQLLEDCLTAKTALEVRRVVEQAAEYRDKGGFVYDPEKETRERQALARKKFEEGKRRRFEERMVRKAKREGLSDLNYYLNQGNEPPTLEELDELRRVDKEKRFEIWKSKFSQHCYPFHFENCTRDRACAFLHSDPGVGESLSFG